MTISSHGWIKLLVAVIAAIVVGIMFDSWGWGIATFFILMFIFIWVASWIFGGPIKGKVEVTDELGELLDKLAGIGNIKNLLPFNQRGWCNSLGLFVQFHEKGSLARLEAGDDKYRSQIDAWLEGSSIESGLEWKVKKYNPGDWEKLVDPTHDIAMWLLEHGGLPKEYMDSFNGAIQVFRKEGHLELPNIKEPPVSEAEVFEEMCRLEDMFGISIHGVGKGLTYAEANIIGRKVNPLFRGSRAFPVSEEASEEEINRWLNHPLINAPLPDTFVMGMAAHTPIPAATIERILRTLLQEDYDMYWKMAKERIRSKKLD